MDSFELNKLIGAFLGAVFVVFSVSLASDAIFSSHAPEQFGYAIEAAEAPAAGGPAADEGPSALALLPDADAAKGEAAFRKCVACHTAEEGGANRIGPNLYDIVNRPIAGHEGFSYSAAMRAFSEDGSVVWDYEHLSGFLRAPRAYVSGTAMAFAGIRNPQEEADLIAYLRTLSANPAPLPEPAAEEAGETEAPAAEGEEAPAEGTAGEQDEQPAPAAEDQPAPAPAQPGTTDDGTSAAPEPDAAQPGGEQPATEQPATPQPAQ